MKPQELANLFGLTIDQFAEEIGYRRQSLYNGIRRTIKSQVAVERLKDLNDHILDMDIAEAKRKYTKRKIAISDFEQSLRECGHYGRK